jgi:hypothetical protein
MPSQPSISTASTPAESSRPSWRDRWAVGLAMVVALLVTGCHSRTTLAAPSPEQAVLLRSARTSPAQAGLTNVHPAPIRVLAYAEGHNALRVVFTGGEGCGLVDHVDVRPGAAPTVTLYVGDAAAECSRVGVLRQAVVTNPTGFPTSTAIDGATGQRLHVTRG